MTTNSTIRRVALSDLIPDPENANLGSPRGDAAIAESIRRFGFADAGVLDKDGMLIGGNKRTNAAAEVGMEDAIIIKHDGKTPIYIQLDDFDLDSPDPAIRQRSRELAYYLNRTGQLSLTWNPERFAADEENGIDLSSLWLPEESAELKLKLTASTPDEEFDFTDFEESEPGSVLYRVVIDSLERDAAEALQKSTPNARIEQYRA